MRRTRDGSLSSRHSIDLGEVKSNFDLSKRTHSASQQEPITKTAMPSGQMDLELKNQLIRQKLEASFDQPYDAKFCIGIIGNPNSGKNDILNKELYNDCAILGEPESKTKIKIFTKQYHIQGKVVHVEYWSAPESLPWLKYTSRCISGLAGLLMFFDVTQSTSLTTIQEWIEEFNTLGESPMTVTKALIGTKIDQPGRRQILQEHAEEYAYNSGFEYYETSISDEIEGINGMFTSIVSSIASHIPPELHRNRPKLEGVPIQYNCPIGLQLDLALEPPLKFKYKQKLFESLPLDHTTTEADWLDELE